MRVKSAAAAVLAAGVIAGPAGAEQASSLTMGIQPSHFERDYGTGMITKIFYLPVYEKYRTGTSA